MTSVAQRVETQMPTESMSLRRMCDMGIAGTRCSSPMKWTRQVEAVRGGGHHGGQPQSQEG